MLTTVPSNTVLVVVGVAQPPPGGLPQTLSLDIPDVLPVNAAITLSYNPGPGYSNLQYDWILAPGPGGGSGTLGFRSLGAGAISAPVTSLTESPALGLSSWNLSPGPYTISVYATDGVNNSNTASQTVTLVSPDFSSLRVYPNPWREDKHDGKPITFDRLPLGATIKIFTVSGRLARTLTPTIDTAVWDLTNDSGDKVASGVYIFMITVENGSAQTLRGKLAVIR